MIFENFATMEKIVILNEDQIGQKLKRMAYQIWENYSDESALEIVGIEGGGMVIAHALSEILKKISNLNINLSTLKINKKAPLTSDISISVKLENKAVVLVDDVANSGKTLMYSLKPIIEAAPKSVSIAVLVDREHKHFPVIPNIVGYAIATTIQDMIYVNYEGNRLTSVHLE
jgi:pyrimidine operon attenuation protein/uracil phosphoribosyltransferase